MNDITTKWVTISEVARHLGVHRSSVKRYIGQGLPAHKLGTGKTSPLRFDLDEVDAWLRIDVLSAPQIGRSPDAGERGQRERGVADR